MPRSYRPTMGSESEGAKEQTDCTRTQLTTTTDMEPGSLMDSDGDMISSVSKTTVTQTAGPRSTTAWYNTRRRRHRK